jgi:SecD/SecF fusion protein
VWFALSGVVILAGMVSLGVRGLNLGIDFKGGSKITFNTSKGYTQGSIANFMTGQGERDAVVQGQGHAVDNTFKQWQITTKSLSRGEQAKLTQAIQSNLGVSKLGVTNVSGTFGHQIAVDAIYGIIVSLLLITIYIAVRFEFKFAMPVILAMLHDIAVTVGVYALVGKEVSVATVAAVLTVLGYSIYDTIIIFDRVRENIPLMRRSPFATIANVSLWETIRRSLATTFITLLPIICLEILGGATLKDFAFALIVGVTSGAYSSIFFAAPLLTIWKEREPEYARRKALAAAAEPATDGDGRSVGALPDSGTAALIASEAALSAEPTPELVDVATATPSEPAAQARREKRRQRRRARPHGRTR